MIASARMLRALFLEGSCRRSGSSRRYPHPASQSWTRISTESVPKQVQRVIRSPAVLMLDNCSFCRDFCMAVTRESWVLASVRAHFGPTVLPLRRGRWVRVGIAAIFARSSERVVVAREGILRLLQFARLRKMTRSVPAVRSNPRVRLTLDLKRGGVMKSPVVKRSIVIAGHKRASAPKMLLEGPQGDRDGATLPFLNWWRPSIPSAPRATCRRPFASLFSITFAPRSTRR